jgi:tRNA isopentenyl-2-thiomethyl-A-37 hydroxylase MiaE
MLEQFDYPDPTMPTGSRSSTTVAPQALIMLNAPVVQDAAARLASRLRNEIRSSDPARLAERAYALLFGRQPTARESERAAAFLQTDAEAALPLLCQTLLATNEFVFVR